MLRTLVRAGAARAYVAADGQLRPECFELLAGLGIAVPARRKLARAELLTLLRARLTDMERAAAGASLALDNARLLGGLLGLSRAEVEILGFVIALSTDEGLRECFGELRARTHANICRHAARVLGLSLRSVQRALGPEGRLRRVPVLDFVRASSQVDGPLALSSTLEDVLVRPLADEEELLAQFLTRVPASSLGLDDYPHVATDVQLLVRYLRAAVARGQRGVNVLVHGSPGTGKTELARAVAAAAGAALYEVNLEDSGQDAREGFERLEAYALCQRFLRGRKHTLLLLDEIEDVFPRRGDLFGYRANAALTKAWTNRLLESNPVPTFWISNAIAQIDRAYLRRFDFILEVRQPPRSVRRKVLERHMAGLKLRPQYLDRLAEVTALSPAHAQRAAATVRLLGTRAGALAERDLERIVHNNLRAYEPAALHALRGRAEVAYDPALVNARVDVAALAAGLARRREGTLCLYGPPGTGKSELAHYLAREADLPVLERRASDLLGKYVGETEQAIARTFERAQDEGALLLIDEADSFLSERSRAGHSWEISQVNEMLVQIERFEGVLVCTTNLIEHLDRAALRRFALKVRFDYLSREQARALLALTLRQLGAAAATEESFTQLDRLRVLTPGDFTAVVRGARLLDRALGATEVLAELAEACAAKRARDGRSLGFGA